MSDASGGGMITEDSGEGGASPTKDSGQAGAAEDDAAIDASVDAAPDSAPLPHNVLGCDKLGGVGEWTQITPPGVNLCSDGGACGSSGPLKFVLDPQNVGTIYLGTDHQGIWKSTDCGGTWLQVNTGANSLTVGAGSQANLVIDPVDPKVLYARAGNGDEFKSTNGGVDWTKIWPSTDPMLKDLTDFIEQLDMDPGDHQHLLLSFHTNCKSAWAPSCLAESRDSGATWSMMKGPGPGSGAGWFVDSTRLVFGSGAGLWRSPDHGATWLQLADQSILGVYGRMYRAKNGNRYLAATWGVLMSTDGDNWSEIANSGESMQAGITGDGTNLYRSNKGVCGEVGNNEMFYGTALESNPKQWMPMPSPGMTQGGYDLGYDLDHHILYSSNCRQGFWRVVTQ
jgi:hypothetical protein